MNRGILHIIFYETTL